MGFADTVLRVLEQVKMWNKKTGHHIGSPENHDIRSVAMAIASR